MGSDPQPRSSFYSARQSIPGYSSDFNPKAVQDAAQNPSPKRKPPTGPFIDAVPAGKYHVAAGMSMETHLKRQAHITFAKRTVRMLKVARWTVLLARILQLFAAIGLVVLLITIRGMDTINGWIMRVPPGVAIIHVLYSIYHNARNPRERPPASSASYALFASASDCCIIPFYVFICLWTWQQRQQMIADPMNKDNWVSVFDKANLDFNQLMVWIVFLTSCSGGGLMVLTAMLSLYLAVTFRRISRLPPDMNPLDDRVFTSLTTRPSSKRFSKSSNTSDDSLGKASRDASPTRRSIPFLEVRTKNGSLNWEFSKDGEQYTKSTLDLPEIPAAMSNVPLLPPAHKFSEYGDSRRSSREQSRSAPNSPGHRKSQSQSYYSENKENYAEPSTPPRPPRHTYKQRPGEWWSAANLQSSIPGFNGSQNSRYSTVSQSDNDAVSTSTFGGDPRASRNTFGHAPSHNVGRPGTPPNIPSYAGSISTASGPSAFSNIPQPSRNNGSNSNRNSGNFQPAHMSSPAPVMPLFTVGTLGTFATDLTPRPLSFPNTRPAQHSPPKNQSPHRNQNQHRNSMPQAPPGRIPHAPRPASMISGGALSPPSPTKRGSPSGPPTSVNTLLATYARPPPQTSLTPPQQMSPTKKGVSGGRALDGLGHNFYNQHPARSPNNGTGLITPTDSAPSSPTKQPQQPGTPTSVRDKKKKYEHLAQQSPGRSTSWEKKQQQIKQLQHWQNEGDRPRVKKMQPARRKSLKELHNEREREKEKEGGTRVVSNSGADFGHMFGNGGGEMRGRIVSGSQVV
ncbi:hypothetical protein ABW20_dc0102127 [Dactylellina cionopaga]|nr:hypothetical protein ABW20_dc0102127 [Dactylellina cionopaga]